GRWPRKRRMAVVVEIDLHETIVDCPARAFAEFAERIGKGRIDTTSTIFPIRRVSVGRRVLPTIGIAVARGHLESSSNATGIRHPTRLLQDCNEPSYGGCGKAGSLGCIPRCRSPSCGI